jgi:hypothetical protein
MYALHRTDLSPLTGPSRLVHLLGQLLRSFTKAKDKQEPLGKPFPFFGE